LLLLLALSALFSLACDSWGEAHQPPYCEVFEMHGTPYERGYQHGEHFASKIKSLYTMLLESSIFPYLNRDQSDVESVLLRYQDPAYDHGQFSYRVMLESAQNLAKTLPPEYLEELHGVADGAGFPFEKVLILNTFVDTLLGFRSITFFIKLIQGPQMLSVRFEGVDHDGVDNDGDGEADEENEGTIDPYEPSPYASMVEVPIDARLHFVIDDKLEGVNPESVRIQLNDELYVAGDPALQVVPAGRGGKTVEAILTPPGGMPAASVMSVIVQAGDLNHITDPPPPHARFMRDERITFTTVGYGRQPYEVENIGMSDGRTQPPSIGFAVRGSATRDGRLLIAHHFAMLDSNVSHKHTVLFIHHPKGGKPFAYVGWAGVIWGFSGMNADGVVYVANSSDTLNNPFTGSFNEGLIFAQLLSSGIPIGIMGREILRGASTVDDALAYLRTTPATFGWNLLLADRHRRMSVAELDSNILEDPAGGCFTYSADAGDPQNLDAYGRRLASVGADDLRAASHYQKNTEDIRYSMVDFDIRPQRYWSSFYFRSLRAFYLLGEQIARRYGRFNVSEMEAVLRTPDLVDHRDSMNAVVYEPERLKLHYAMGQEPATDGPFVEYDLGAAVGGGAP
jgi:hypothetical protein